MITDIGGSEGIDTSRSPKPQPPLAFRAWIVVQKDGRRWSFPVKGSSGISQRHSRAIHNGDDRVIPDQAVAKSMPD